MPYAPDHRSLRRHPVPDWFHNAKLGIFIHWGLFSVPGWAPITGELDKVVQEQGWEAWFANNPYAEWYSNSLRIDGSSTQRYHAATYGDLAYDDFVPQFDTAAAAWDAQAWATLFRQVGARYVVPVTKHHDGFLLWPSTQTAPGKGRYRAERDLIGELAQAVRSEGMRFGLYYSGGLDWNFEATPIRDLTSLMAAVPQSEAYAAYATAHWRELIERYQPSILWNDIGYPAVADTAALFAEYYDAYPDGVINDRFRQAPPAADGEETDGRHYDFRTPEYTSYDTVTPYKWEATRGIGFSFGFNRNEGPEQHVTVERLVRMFVDIVSKNGNLLLNVGPEADGTIPALQRERLEGLGRWLQTNGEAIFDTRPWHTAEATTADNMPLRFTRKNDVLYAIVLDTPSGRELGLRGLRAHPETHARLLGRDDELAWRQDGEQLTISLPPDLAAAPAHAIALSPEPTAS